jgi:hypothetical protein
MTKPMLSYPCGLETLKDARSTRWNRKASTKGFLECGINDHGSPDIIRRNSNRLAGNGLSARLYGSCASAGVDINITTAITITLTISNPALHAPPGIVREKREYKVCHNRAAQTVVYFFFDVSGVQTSFGHT